jgi:hypothetical protein
MCSLQKMLDGSVAPVAPHPNDIVDCSDGSSCRRADALRDCAGGYHRTDDERFDAEVQIVSDALDEHAKWAEDYCTGNGDYPDGYAYIVGERSSEWPDRVREWVEGEYGDTYGHTDFDDYIDEVVEAVCAELDADFDCEPEYSSNEYAAYSGKGCCLDSFSIDEYEDQVEINGHAVLKELHDRGELDNVLDEVRCDAYVSRDRRREKNEETGRYEYVGRETYMPYANRADYPTLDLCISIGGQWHWVVDADRMKELVADAILEYHGYEDCDD